MDAYERSFLEAQAIARDVPETVLIGGWAVWSYNPHLKSRDIDLLIAPRDLWRLEAFLRGRGFAEISGAPLGKRGFRVLHEDASIDVDVYDEGIGPYRVEDLLPRTAERRLGDVVVRVLEPTELLALKIVAASDRRGTEKGGKDLADILGLLLAVGGRIDWTRITGRLPRKTIRDVLRTALSDYRMTSRLLPLSMADYRRLKQNLDRKGIL